jgi:WD40 repeat protein
VGSGDGRLRLVDAATGNVRWDVQACRGSRPVIRSVSMSQDGRVVASVGDSEECWKLWDAASGDLRMTGARHDGTGACICKANRSGRRKSLDEGCPVQAHTSGLHAVAFSPGQRLATGGMDRAVILWDAQTGKAERVMHGHTHRISSLCFSAKGERLASGSWDTSIRVWDVTSGALLRTLSQPQTQGAVALVLWVHFSDTDKLFSSHEAIPSVGDDTIVVKQWDVDSGEMIRIFEGCIFAAVSPDGRMIATASDQGAQDVLLVDSESGVLRVRMVGHNHEVISAFFSKEDGSKLVSGCSDGECMVWDTSTGALLRTLLSTRSKRGWTECVHWGCDWLLDTQKNVAFAMGHHPRLGAGSRVLGLDEELLRMILDRV